MQKVDGFYLYEVGGVLQRLKALSGSFGDDDEGTSCQEAASVLRRAEESLTKFLQQGDYKLKTSLLKGNELKEKVKELIEKTEKSEDKKEKLGFLDAHYLRQSLDHFEAVLASEFALLDLYVITKKGNYDISGLMTKGEDCFPKDLALKVPECIPDIQAGTKCIAVSLPTAAGFHLHRANEAVLHRYWDAVTDNAERPKKRNMGVYIHELNKLDAGDKRVRSALRDLKDFHRNPLIHPDEILESVDDAIALMNHIYTVILHMLKEIPDPGKIRDKRQNLGGAVDSMKKVDSSILRNLKGSNVDENKKVETA